MLMGVKGNLKLIFDYYKLNLKKEWKYKSSFFMQIIMMIVNDLFLRVSVSQIIYIVLFIGVGLTIYKFGTKKVNVHGG